MIDTTSALGRAEEVVMKGLSVGVACCAAVLGLGPLVSVARAQERGHEARSIVEVARASGQFKTLVAALEAAGLADALSGAGPFTVFAPTDAAFAALPAGTVEALLRDPPALRRVLLHHVARGARPATEVVQYEAVRTLADTTLAIRVEGASVRIAEARVTRADVGARNGVIHVIDRVLLPAPQAAAAAVAPTPDLLAVAESTGTFGTLVAAVRAAGLDEALSGAGPFTVFAPSDAAFAVLPAGALEALLRDRERLATVLRHHVVAGALAAKDVAAARTLTTLAGTTLTVDARDGVLVGGAAVVTADVRARNGVIHVIDRLLLPPAQDSRTGARMPADPADATWTSVRVGGDLTARSERRGEDWVAGACSVTTPLPQGYPAPTPPGAIELKRYPAVRRAEVRGTANPEAGMYGSFMPLFRHIQREGISMTSPVEMDYSDLDGAGAPWVMSFLYRTPDQGRAGDAGSVVVVDRGPVTVLSIGLTGTTRLDRLREAEADLARWLAGQSRWVAAGAPRALFYNGPEVAPGRRWVELQLPVTAAGASAPLD
jgi:uncharacterized surface protein with fasciclin (FAS1) repeats